MRLFFLLGLSAVALLGAAGCGKAPATLAGGKPVSHWTAALRDRDPKVRREAAAKLGNVGPADPAALPALVEGLRDADAGVRREVVLALVKCGPAARAAEPALDDLRQHDRDARVRTYAAKALEKLRGGE